MNPIDDVNNPKEITSKRSKALEALLKQILMQEETISFAKYMQYALYHPELGYYQTPGFNFGNEGDFTTAPEISPLYAECFAIPIMDILEKLGNACILELGAGTGRFAKDLLTKLYQKNSLPEFYYIYEISTTLQEQQKNLLATSCPFFIDRIKWIDTLPPSLTGIVIANEVLDALPVHCFQVDNNEFYERSVSLQDDQFVWKKTTITDPLFIQKLADLSHLRAIPDYQSEMNLFLCTFIKEISNSLSKGIIFFIDYGSGQKEYYHPRRHQGSLKCFYKHRIHSNPFILLGSQDITANVNFTAVAEEAVHNDCELLGLTSQASFLLGYDLILHAKRSYNNPLQELEIAQAIKTLLLPTEMGEKIKVMALAKNINIDLKGFHLEDRRHEL